MSSEYKIKDPAFIRCTSNYGGSEIAQSECNDSNLSCVGEEREEKGRRRRGQHLTELVSQRLPKPPEDKWRAGGKAGRVQKWR